MNIDGNRYIARFVTELETGDVYNDAAEYGVEIRPCAVADGEPYWRVLGVHHLQPAENEGAHTILVEALDEDGRRIRGGRAFAAMTWQGKEGPPDVKALEKVSQDPMGCDFPMFKGTIHEVWMKGFERSAGDPSDRVAQLHTGHADEATGNTLFHHSYFVVFQRAHKAPAVLDRDAVLSEARRLRDEQVNAASPLSVYAREHHLGAPVTPEFRAGGYVGRGFERGVAFAPSTRSGEIEHVAW